MTKAVRALAGGPWLEPGDGSVDVAGITLSAAFLEGLSAEDAAEIGLEVADVAESAPPTDVKVLGAGLIDVDGTPTRAWETTSYTEEEVGSLAAGTILAIKAEARRRILDRYPDWKQANMTKRAVELVDLRLDRSLTTEEEAERQALKSAAAWVDSVRTASDQIEALVTSDPAEIAALAATVPTHELWPA